MPGPASCSPPTRRSPRWWVRPTRWRSAPCPGCGSTTGRYRSRCPAGFNDIAVSRDLELTSVRLPLRQMGATALQIALAPAPGDALVQTELPTELVLRATTGPVRAAAPEG